MAKKQQELIESVLDLNANNVWSVTPEMVAQLWAEDRKEESFRSSEDKMLNIMRATFEVVHYNPHDPREASRYENGEWSILEHVDAKRGNVAIRPRVIKRITDLTYENVKHVTVATLLELLDRNFGGGWDSIPLSLKDIIESAFDISTTTLPASRLHMPGGTLDKKVADGYDYLEVAKGTWTEAIFAKKKEPVMKVRFQNERLYDEDGNLIVNDDEEDQDLDNDQDMDPDQEPEMDDSSDDTYFSSYAEEANQKDEDEEGFPIEE